MTAPGGSTVTRVAATALLVLALLAMGFGTGERALVFPLVVGAIASFFVRIEGEVAFRTYILFGIPFAFLARFHPVEGSSEQGLNIPFYIALYMQLVAVRKLASETPNVAHVVFCATSGVAAIGADTDPVLYHRLVIVLVIPLLISVRGALVARRQDSKRRARGLGVAFAALGVFALTEGASVFIENIYEDVSRAVISRVARVPLPSAGGFSGAARLGGVSGLQAGTEASSIALRAFAKFAPGYLRARTFQDYEKGEWTSEPDGANARPVQLSADSKVGRLVLEGRAAPLASETPVSRIVPASDYGRYFFLPLHATAIDTTSEVVKFAPGGAVESPFDSTASGYSVFTSREPVHGTGWTKLPADPDLLAALDRILAEIGPRETPLDLVQAIRDWFQRSYVYKFGIDFEPGSDPLLQFLTKKKHGHCELFASAGALLLRRRGVPARYTTGYLCEEKNAHSDDLWVARNRHAHAWVEFHRGAPSGRPEFHDAKRGWETAEFTPDTGMPSFQPATGLEAWLDAAHGAWDRLRAIVAEQGVGGLVQLALGAGGDWLTQSWPGRGLVLILFLYVVRRGAKRLPKKAPRRKDRVLPGDLEAERKRYLAFERALARRGSPRSDSETLEEFAARLSPADAALVRAYAARRYARFS